MIELKNAHVKRNVEASSVPQLNTPACPYRECSDHGKSDQVSIYVYYGRKQTRLLICKSCGHTFSELRGSPLWDSRLDYREVIQLFESLVVDGLSIRATARIRGKSKNTVKRYLRMAKSNGAELWQRLAPHLGKSHLTRERFEGYVAAQRSR